VSLPPGWTIERLDKCCDVILGQSPPGNTYNGKGEGLPFFQGKAEFGAMYPRAIKWCTQPTKIAEPDDVLISVRAPVGPTNVANARCAIGRGLAALRARENVRPKWVLYGLRASEQALRILAGGSTFEAITGQQLRAHTLPLPPPDEQDRIVAEIEKQLTRLDVGIETARRLLAHIATYRSSVLRAAVRGRLVPTEASLAGATGRSFEPASQLLARLVNRRPRPVFALPAVSAPADLPEGWVWASADMVGDILLGRQRAPQFLTGKYSRPYLRVANVKDDALDFSDIERMDFDPTHFKKYRLQVGDVLVSEGQSPHLVGQSAIYDGSIDGLCFQKTLHRFRPLPDGPQTRFAQIVFRAMVKTGTYKRFASITTNIAHLTLEKFKASPFPLPPLQEQDRIVTEVERRMSVADALQSTVEQQLHRGNALRRSILRAAFDGHLIGSTSADGHMGASVA
jgi:type I restriction enzyme S subunit